MACQIQSFGNYDLREITPLKHIKYERKYNGKICFKTNKR